MKNKIIIATILLACNYIDVRGRYLTTDENSPYSNLQSEIGKVLTKAKNEKKSPMEGLKEAVNNFFLNDNMNELLKRNQSGYRTVVKDLEIMNKDDKAKGILDYFQTLETARSNILESLKKNNITDSFFNLLDEYNKIQENNNSDQDKFSEKFFKNIIDTSESQNKGLLEKSEPQNKGLFEKFVTELPNISEVLKTGNSIALEAVLQKLSSRKPKVIKDEIENFNNKLKEKIKKAQEAKEKAKTELIDAFKNAKERKPMTQEEKITIRENMETYIQNGGTQEDLQNLIKDNVPVVEQGFFTRPFLWVLEKLGFIPKKVDHKNNMTDLSLTAGKKTKTDEASSVGSDVTNSDRTTNREGTSSLLNTKSPKDLTKQDFSDLPNTFQNPSVLNNNGSKGVSDATTGSLTEEQRKAEEQRDAERDAERDGYGADGKENGYIEVGPESYA